jgi:glucose/arabinose dehydrogenase
MGAALVACALTASTAVAAGPPPPKAANGNKVAVVGQNAGVPTQFAWHKGDMFIASAAEGEEAKGGIYVIKKGTKKAKRVPGSPSVAFGIAAYKGKFYISEGSKVSVYARWNGKRFKSKKVVLKANQKNFTSFNGVAIAPSGRIYAGVTFEFDSAASEKKYASSVVSFGRTGGDLKVIATGIRQPWQLTFLDGEKQPIGTNLGSDTPEGTDAADFIYKADPGSNFGFPTCEWGPSDTCDSFTKPLLVIPKSNPAQSPTGITHHGQKLFVAFFDPIKPRVVSMNKKGKSVKTVLRKFPAPAVGVGVYKGHLYSSDVTGQIYKVKL